jgi:hypothetical protein
MDVGRTGVGGEDRINLDLEELLGDFDNEDDDDNDDDDNDLTDRHWKRGSEEPHDPTTSSTGNRDGHDKLDQVSEQGRPVPLPTHTHTSSSLPHCLTAVLLHMADRARRDTLAKSFV